jgi:hypothetical protein
VPLEDIQIVCGVLNLAFIGLSIYLGGSIALKYRANKNKNFLYVGFAWILFCSGWWGTTTSFIIALFTNTDGCPFESIMLINFIPLPFGVILWLYAFTNFMYKRLQKPIITSFVCLLVIFEAVFISMIILDPVAIGVKINAVDTRTYNPIFYGFLLVVIISVLITGILFAREMLKMDDPEMKLKAKLMFVAWPLFGIGGFLDAGLPLSFTILIITRIMLFTSAILFYGGFILPNWMKTLFLREKSESEA